jgi:hypothetical protein
MANSLNASSAARNAPCRRPILEAAWRSHTCGERPRAAAGKGVALLVRLPCPDELPGAEKQGMRDRLVQLHPGVDLYAALHSCYHAGVQPISAKIVVAAGQSPKDHHPDEWTGITSERLAPGRQASCEQRYPSVKAMPGHLRDALFKELKIGASRDFIRKGRPSKLGTRSRASSAARLFCCCLQAPRTPPGPFDLLISAAGRLEWSFPHNWC